MEKLKLQCNKHDDSLCKDVCFLESNATQHCLDIQTFKKVFFDTFAIYFISFFFSYKWLGRNKSCLLNLTKKYQHSIIKLSSINVGSRRISLKTGYDLFQVKCVLLKLHVKKFIIVQSFH